VAHCRFVLGLDFPVDGSHPSCTRLAPTTLGTCKCNGRTGTGARCGGVPRLVTALPPKVVSCGRGRGQHAGSTPADSWGPRACKLLCLGQGRSRRWTRWNADVGRWDLALIALCHFAPLVYTKSTNVVSATYLDLINGASVGGSHFNPLKANHGNTI
jgi:hypothetical protein